MTRLCLAEEEEESESGSGSEDEHTVKVLKKDLISDSIEFSEKIYHAKKELIT